MDFEEWTSSDDVVLSRRDALSLSPGEGAGDDLFEAQLLDEDEDEKGLQVQVVLEDVAGPEGAEEAASLEPAVLAPQEDIVVEAELSASAAADDLLVPVRSPSAAIEASIVAEPVLETQTEIEAEAEPTTTSASISEPADEVVAVTEPVDASAALEAHQSSEPAQVDLPAEVDPVAEAAKAAEAAEAAEAAKAAKAAKRAAKKAAKAAKAAEAALAAEAAEATAAAQTESQVDPIDRADETAASTDEAEPAASAPAQPFDAAPAGVRAALARRGFDGMTLVQEAVLAAEAGSRDLQISSQTGSGKTIALGFVLARTLEGSREPGPLALVIVPTRELANQVCEELGWLFADLDGVQVGSVVGGNPVWRDRQLLSRRPRVLVGTPGRLLDHVSSRTLDLSNVKELVLDEADQMLDMGFREELEGILDATPKERRTHMVSATFPTGIQRLAERYQRDPLAIQGTQLGHANADIEHRGHLIHQRDRFGVLVNLLLEAGDVRTLIFVERRADTVEVAEKLESEGFAALPLSGELAQSQRERTLAAFRAGRASVLVATDVAARGLDVPDVRLVIHTAPPLDAETYTHRSGRTGRAGQTGSSVLLAAPSRRRRVARLMSEAGIDFKWRPAPTAASVRALVAERHRDELATEIATALADGASATRVDEAKALLA